MVRQRVVETGIEYTHQILGENYCGLAGYYAPQKEVRLTFGDREVLYVVGRAALESSCCGNGDWSYTLVPGYVVKWHTRVNEAGLPVSTVEPIMDGETRSRISQVIREQEGIDRISFW